MDNKKELRALLLPKRKNRKAPLLNIEVLSGLPEFKNARSVFCYVSSYGEVDTTALLWEIAKEKRLTIPYCTDKKGHMICVEVNSPTQLTDGAFGIPAPIEAVPFPKENLDFVIVPGIAFDSKGYRLGYGKGYYDRFLKDISPYKLGVCEQDFFLDTLPHNENDIKMDKVIII